MGRPPAASRRLLAAGADPLYISILERLSRKEAAHIIATLRTFKELATPEMIDIRNSIRPSVVGWVLEPELIRRQSRTAHRQINCHREVSEAALVRRLVETHPGLTPSELSKVSGICTNNVNRDCSYDVKHGLLRREYSGNKTRAGLKIWKYYAIKAPPTPCVYTGKSETYRRILDYVQANAGCTPSEISKGTGIAHNIVSSRCNSAMAKGLLRREFVEHYNGSTLRTWRYWMAKST